MHKIIKEDLERIKQELSQFAEKIQGKVFFVTGGAGFLGSWFCDVLDMFGAKIICVDNLSSGHVKNIEHLLNKPNFKFVNVDVLSYDPDEKIDYMVHMASIAAPQLYMEYPIETLDSNILATKKLLELARKHNVLGFLFTSTSEIYGNLANEHVPTHEEFHGVVNTFGPRSMYDEGKRAAEAYCHSYFQKFKLPIRIARIFNTFGPRLDIKGTSQYGRAIIKFIHQAITGKSFTVYGDGKQTRSFCYITDQIVGLFKLLLTPGIDGQVFNIGNDIETSMFELVTIIKKQLGTDSQIVFDSLPTYNLKDDPRRRCPNITKARTLLSYSPKVKLEEGVVRTAEWLRDNLTGEEEL